VDLVGRIADQARSAGVDCILRGDSTLRGHLFEEMDTLGLDAGTGLLVPAFPAAGRTTLGGVHYVQIGGVRYNVADTEFARDPVFGYRGRSMAEIVAERGGPRPVRLIAHDDLSPSTVATALCDERSGTLVVPDAGTDEDLAVIASGYRLARAAGRRVVLRCAAPLAALLAAAPGRTVEPPGPVGRVLVVCGSHTGAASAQLLALGGLGAPVSVPTSIAFGPDRSATIDSIVDLLRRQLDSTGVAVVATERERRAEHGGQAAGAAVMAALMAVVRRLAGEVDAVVAKGGITSAEVASTGLAASRARVLGQVETGIALWQVGTTPVAVVPGNIGDDQTLVRLVRYFQPSVGIRLAVPESGEGRS
jgi:uncharacterized protein YgbK (DUF1537 family)